MARSAPIQVRVPEDQRGRWQGAADGAGMSLAEWVREACERQFERVLAGQAPAATYPAAGRGSRAKRPPRGACGRAAFHRPGAFCKECGTTPAAR